MRKKLKKKYERPATELVAAAWQYRLMSGSVQQDDWADAKTVLLDDDDETDHQQNLFRKTSPRLWDDDDWEDDW